MVRRTFESIKNLLINEQNEILSVAAMMMVLSLITKVTGMLFLSLQAREFGNTFETDLFYLASVLPETITNIILLGSISGSIIPIFVKIREKDGEGTFIKSFSSTLNSGMLLFVVLSVVAAIFARELLPLAIHLFKPRTILTVNQINEVVWMMRMLLIPQIILSLSAFFSTWLNIHERFIIPQLAPLFFNLGKILGIIVIVPLLGGSIWGLIWGTLAGSLLHILIQLPLIYHLRIGIMPFFIDLKDKNFLQVLKLGIPRTLSLSIEQVAVISDSLIAFGLTAGALTSYQLAVRLIAFPLTLFGTSYAIASFPSLAKLYAKNAISEFSILFYKIMNQVLFLTIPLAVIFIVLRVPIVRLLYGTFGGEFSWYDTLQVAWVVLFFSIGITFESLRSIIFRVYYATHNSVVPFISSILVMVFGIITGILFTNYLSHFDTFSLTQITWHPSYFFSKGLGGAGVGGLAISSSLVFSLEFFFLLLILHQRKIIHDAKPFLRSLAKKLLAALVMLVVCYVMTKLWEEILNTAKTLQLIVLTVTTLSASTMIYLWISYVLRIEEVDLFVNYAIKNLRRVWNLLTRFN